MPNSRDTVVSNNRVESFIFYALILLIVLSPIPNGSNRNWSWSLCALIISSLLILWVVNVLIRNRQISLSLSPVMIGLFLFPGLWAFMQASSFMPQILAHPLWSMINEVLGEAVQATISLSPDNSKIAAMRLFSYGMVFFLSFQFCRSKFHAETMLKYLAYSAVIYALYGVITHWGNINIFFWIEPETKLSSLNSTFINRNSYATYAGLGLLCLMARSITNASRHDRAAYGALMSRQAIIENYIFSNWQSLLGLMLLTTALIGTESRGGFFSVVIAVFTLQIIIVVKTKLKTKLAFASVAGVLIVVTLAFSASSNGLFKRLDLIQSESTERLNVFELTLDAIKDNPLLGAGYGGYQEGFRLYRSDEVRLVYDKTHNTYLENAFELGLPASASLLLAIFWVMVLSIKGVMRRRRDWFYPAAGVSATMLVAVHSLFDFSLQIPAIAITYAAIMGMSVAQSFSSIKKKSSRQI